MAIAAATTKPVPYGASSTTLNDYLTKGGQPTDAAAINTLWNGAFGSFGTKYSGSAAQNAALLHALQTGYKSNVDNGTISGSSSAKNNQNTQTAMGSGSASLGNSQTNPTPPPGSSASTVPAPTATSTSTNPTIASYQTSTNTALDQAHEDSTVALQPITDTYNQNLQTLQTAKTNALSAAKASYARANPYGSGSDADEFYSGIEKSYDAQIQNLQSSYGDAVSENSQQLQDNINTINSTYVQNVQAYQQNQTQNLQWTLANDPPQPLSTKGITDQKGLQSALMSWGAQNQSLVDMAFSTGQYGDENNMQDYYNVVAMLSQPTKATIEEQTQEENVAIGQENANSNASRAGSAAISADAAAQNANTNAGNAGATTTTTKPNFFQGLLNNLTGTPSTSVTQKQTSLVGNGNSNSSDSNPLGW